MTATDSEPELEIAAAAPTDDDGHPTHPEEGYRICGATKSDRTTPTEHGRERDEYEYCLLRAGWGVDDTQEGTCSHHLGAVDNRGENNPNYKHGAFSKHLASDLTDDEAEALDDLAEDLGDPERAPETIRRQAAEAYLKYKRSGDDRFLREYRQLLSTFNIVDAPDQVEVEHSGEIDGERTLGEEELAAIRQGLAASRDDT